MHHNVFSYLPFNVEMHYLLAMHLHGGPWAGMYLAQLMHAAFFVLTILTLYALARQGILAAFVAGIAPWTLLLASVAYDEGGLLLFGTLALGWAMRALPSSNSRRSTSGGAPTPQLLLSGLFTGLACGSKLTAVPLLLIGIPLALSIVQLPSRPTIRPYLTGIAIFLLTATLSFSPWLIRNVAWAGNPVFPQALEHLGRGHFTPVQVERWRQAHSPRPDQQTLAARLDAAWRQILGDWRYGYLLLPLAGAAAAFGIRSPRVQFLALLLLSLTVFWLFFTHLQSRFFVPAVPIAALLIAQAPWKRAQPFIAAALVVVAVQSFLIVHHRLDRFVGIVGAEQLAELTPPAAADASPDATLCLIGDAKAFWYQRPMSRLLYRTVFDAPGDGNGDALHTWIDQSALASHPNPILLIDGGELRRFAKTYWKIPPLPQVISTPTDGPFVLPRPLPPNPVP